MGEGEEEKKGEGRGLVEGASVRSPPRCIAVPRLSSGRMLRPVINALTRPRLIILADKIVFSKPTAVTDGQANTYARFELDFRPLLLVLPFVNAQRACHKPPARPTDVKPSHKE